MKISEFKKRLDWLEELHGDIEVVIDTSPYGVNPYFEPAEPHFLNKEKVVEVYF